MMKAQDKRVNTVNIPVEPNKGDLSLLSCNKSGNGSPFLDYELNFSTEDIEAYIELGRLLKRTHIRLLIEGYTITDNEIIPPYQKNES